LVLTDWVPQVYAQDQLALMQYKRGDYHGALELLNKALNTCLQHSVGKLHYCLLQSHKSVVLSAQDSHDKSHAILEEYLMSLNSATRNPLGDIKLIETEKIVSHLLVVSLHNLSTQLAYLKRWDEAIEITARVLSLMNSGVHRAQPISRMFVQAHAASLRMQKAGGSSFRLCASTEATEEKKAASGRSRRGGSLSSSMDLDSSSFNASMDAPREGRWNKWLAIAGQGRAVAPLVIDLPRPEVDDLASLDDVPSRGFKDYKGVLGASVQQFPKLDSMEVCPDEVLGTVSRAILQFVDEGLYSRSEVAAAERYEQIEKLLDEDLFEFCGQLRWDVQVYGIMSKAQFFYNRLQDYESAAKHAERALEKAKEQEMGSRYHVALCQLCIGACLLKAGHHDDAFIIGKEALTYCHGLSNDELQEPKVRVQMEDVLVGASQLMALAHIFLGNSKVALKLSKIAKEHIKYTSYFGNKSTVQYTQVSRVYEVAMSMDELAVDKNRFHIAPKREKSWMPKTSSIVPTNFVPSALHRNLPELYPDTNQASRRTRSALSTDFTLPGEEVVHGVLNKKQESASPHDRSPERQADADAVRARRRYKWTGRYAAALNSSTDQVEFEDASAIASISMTAQLTQHPHGISFLEKPQPGGISALSSTSPSRGQTDQRLNVKTARPGWTPYGHLAVSGPNVLPDPSFTGHRFVDELMHDKEEVRKRYASEPSSNVFFAKVYARARDQNSMLQDPMAKVIPQKNFVVGDHVRPQVGGAKAPTASGIGTGSQPPHLLRDWGPDPTLQLRRSTSTRLGTRLSKKPIAARSQTALGLQSRAIGNALDLDASCSSMDSFEAARRESLKFDMNEVRVNKHRPYHSVVQQSALGLFVSREERSSLLENVDRHCREKKGQSLLGTIWPELEDKIHSDSRPLTTAKCSVSRPWHWSHAPEPSPFLHQGRGEKHSNEHYRATPYGTSLTPAAQLAYGTNGMPALGRRSLQTVEISQRDIVASAELSRPKISKVAVRSFSSFS
jgi:tetratricopeptide (TPR) repeat protein